MVPEHLSVSLGHRAHRQRQDTGIWAEEQVDPVIDRELLPRAVTTPVRLSSSG